MPTKSFTHLTNEELLRLCIGKSYMTDLEYELFIRLEVAVDRINKYEEYYGTSIGEDNGDDSRRAR